MGAVPARKNTKKGRCTVINVVEFEKRNSESPKTEVLRQNFSIYISNFLSSNKLENRSEIC